MFENDRQKRSRFVFVFTNDLKCSCISGSNSIGYAIAKKLAEDGASVVISSRKQENVDRAVAELRKDGFDASGIVCDVGKEQDRKKLVDFAVEKKGGIDIFVSNVGVNPCLGSVLDVPMEIWDEVYEINIKSPILLTKEIVPQMDKRGGGSIVFIASIAGYRPWDAIGVYSVSKTTLLALTKGMSVHCAPMNIRVNCVCPGFIRTNFSKILWSDKECEDEISAKIPLNRIGNPEECAGVTSFLCSDDASYVTGESVIVSGGYYCRL